jgi:hypothetical protein
VNADRTRTAWTPANNDVIIVAAKRRPGEAHETSQETWDCLTRRIRRRRRRRRRKRRKN